MATIGTLQRDEMRELPFHPSPQLAGLSCTGDTDFNEIECVDSWDYLNEILVPLSGWLGSCFLLCQWEMDVVPLKTS